MTNVLTGAERFIAQWRQSTAEGNLYSPDDLTTYILGTGVVPGNGRQVSTLATYLLNNAVFNVKDYGAKGDGVTDDTATIQAAITAATTGGVVYFPLGTYIVSSTLQVNVNDLSFQGRNRNRTTIKYTGSGSAIQLGTDDGNAYTIGEYNGVGSGFGLLGILLQYTGTTDTALVNGLGNYKSGTYGVRDWRGGSVRLEHSYISGFHYGFWGVQSDLNVWHNMIVGSNKIGAYLGPRSDQITVQGLWSFQNDTMWQIEGAGGGRVYSWTTDTDGSTSTYPCVIKNYNDGAGHIRAAGKWTFDKPWLERLDSTLNTQTCQAFFNIGSGDTTLNDVVTLRDPQVLVNFWNATPGTVAEMLYVVRADQCKSVVIDGASSQAGVSFAANIRAMVKVVNDGAATTVPLVKIIDHYGDSLRTIENFSATAVTLIVHGWSAATYSTNANGGTGAVTQVVISDNTTSATLKATDHISVGTNSDPGGSVALFRGNSSGPNTGHVLDVVYDDGVTHGPRVVVNANATEVVFGSTNAFPHYLQANGEYKWKVGIVAGTSSLTSVQATTKVVPGSNGWQLRNSADSQDNFKVDDTGIALALGALGYGAGAGGTVTQATSKATGVTLNKVTGQITMNAAALAAGTIVSFVLTNSAIKNPDLLILNHVSGGTPGSYSLNARVTADGSATIDVRNNTGGSLSEAIVIGYTIMRGQTA